MERARYAPESELPPNPLIRAGLIILFLSMPVSISVMQIGLGVALLGAFWHSVKARRVPRTPMDLPILIFLALTLLSAMLSVDQARGLKQFLAGWTVAGLYLIVGYARREEFLRRLLSLLFWSATLIAVYAIVQHLTGWDFIRPGTPLESLELGQQLVFFPRGTFSHYQTFTNVFFLFFCLSFAQVMHNRSAEERRWWLVAALTIGVALVFSYTRGIWLASLFAMLFIIAFMGKRGIAAVTGVVVVAGLVVSLSSSGISSRVKTIIDREGNMERLLLWETTWNMIRDYPLLGVGVGNYQREQREYVRDDVPLPMIRSHSHNVLLQVTVERGIFGLLVYLWMWYLIIKHGLVALHRLRGKDGYQFGLVLGCVTGTLGFFIDGLFQNNFGDTEVVIPFWIIVGVIFLHREKGRPPLPSPAGRGGTP